MDELGHLGWVAHRSYELERMFFGIRTNSRPFAAWLDSVLVDYQVLDEQAEPNFSVLIGEDGKFGRRFHILYRDSTALVSTFDLALLARALLEEAESLTFAGRRDATYVNAAFVMGHGVTALVPPDLVPLVDRMPRKVERAGLSVPLTGFTAIDQSGQATRTPSMFDLERAIDDLPPRICSDEGPLSRPTIEHPTSVDIVCIPGSIEHEPVAPVSRGLALRTLSALTKNLDGSGLNALARLVEQAECYRLGYEPADQMLVTLTELLQSASSDTRSQRRRVAPAPV